MKHNHNCPLCASPLHSVGQSLLCRGCGWNKVNNGSTQKKLQNRISKGVLAVGVSLMLALIYVGHFGAYSVKVLPLKIQQLTGGLDSASHARLIQICTDLKQYDCMEKAHLSYFHSSRDVKVLEKLARLQSQRNKPGEALKTYHLYFQNKGQDFKAAYSYARLLETKGQKKLALKYYRYALSAGAGDTLRVSVMRSYIRFLVAEGKTYRAKRELAKIRPRIKKSSALVQQEYSRWQAQVKRRG